jgi:excisionase family DNA binding protein
VTSLDDSLRELITEVVRDEIKRALAELVPAPERLSTADAAREARVHPRTLRRWIRDGKLRCEHAGREIRIKRSDLNAALRSSPTRTLTPEQMADRDFGRP